MSKNKRPHWSKRKDPDKLIEQLKDEVSWLQKVRNRILNAEQGEIQFTMKNMETTVSFEGTEISPLLFPGTKLNIKGEVSGIRRDRTGTKIDIEFNRCFRKVEEL